MLSHKIFQVHQQKTLKLCEGVLGLQQLFHTSGSRYQTSLYQLLPYFTSFFGMK